MLHAKRKNKNHKNWTPNSTLSELGQWAVVGSAALQRHYIQQWWQQPASHTRLLQSIPRGSNSALPKITPTRAGQESPHTHIAESAETQPANPKQIPHVWGFIYWQKIQRQGDGQFLPGLHCKIFAQFYQWSNINPFSVLTRLPYFLYSKSKDAWKSVLHTSLKMKDLFLIKANKMMSTLKLSFKLSGLILFLIKKTFHLRKKKIKIYTVKLKCYILGSFFCRFWKEEILWEILLADTILCFSISSPQAEISGSDTNRLCQNSCFWITSRVDTFILE